MKKGKRIFLNWADGSPERMKEILTLRNRGHQIVYWTGLPGDRSQIPDVIYHDHYAAWDNVSAESVDPSEFPPPSADLIKEFYETESLILTMMNKRYDGICVDERRHIYYNMLGYWYGVLKKYKPDVVGFHGVPHTVYNYIIYALAKKMGIKTVMFEDPWVAERFLMYTDFKEGNKPFLMELKKNQGKNFSLNDLSPRLKEYYLNQTNPKQDSTPVYMKYWKKKHSTLNRIIFRINLLKNSIKDFSVFKKVPAFIIRQFGPNLEREYGKLTILPDFSKKFVYVPLGFQPERTTSPQGDMFVDQILMIETISASLPKDWIIYVKEHPSQWWLRSGIRYSCARYKGYYRRIAKIKNVKLVPITTNTYNLIDKAQAVAVATGTAGWEALLRSKPTLAFGYPWYRDCPELFRINSVELCKSALDKINNGWKVNQQKMIYYLKCFDNVALHGSPEVFVAKKSKVSEQETRDNMFKAFVAEVENLP